MTPVCPHSFSACRARFPRGAFAAILAGILLVSSSPARVAGGEPMKLPSPVEEADFAELKALSPFRRALDLSQTMALTGLARVDGETVATIRDRETSKTHIISADGEENENGWRLVAIEGDPSEPGTISARISHLGDEEFTVKFDNRQLEPPRPTWRQTMKFSREEQDYIVHQARNFREGIRGDGFRGPPPPQLTEKLARLSQGQREEIIARVADMRRRGAESEERQQALFRMVDRALAAGR